VTIHRAAFEAKIEVASAGEGEAPFIIRGKANSYGVMRSGRLIMPTAMSAWFESEGEKRLPFMGKHGAVPGFATIGTATELKSSASGFEFKASLARGTQLADEARTLISQGHLKNISLGWAGMSRIVKADDAEIDPAVKRAMKKAGVRIAEVFYVAEPVEISLVDVGDDRHARLAADIEGGDIGKAIEAIVAERFKAIEARFETLIDRLESSADASCVAAAANQLNYAGEECSVHTKQKRQTAGASSAVIAAARRAIERL
jgi:phage head maturation protease